MNNAERPTIWIDTETGGFAPYKQDLLTIALVLIVPGTDNTLAAVGAVSKEEYRVTESALKVNGLDLDELRRTGKPIEDVDAELTAFVVEQLKHFPKLRLGGQNLNFDFDFIRVQLPQLWEVFKAHGLQKRGNHVDTRHMAETLMEAEYIRPTSASLESLCDWYGIEYGQHTAVGDAVSTAEVYQAMMKTLATYRSKPAGLPQIAVKLSNAPEVPMLLMPAVPQKGDVISAYGLSLVVSTTPSHVFNDVTGAFEYVAVRVQ